VRPRLALASLAAALCMGAAADPAERLADPGQEAEARAIFEQVRCLVCQNESIDDSDAALAHDLRRLVREQVAAGRSPAEIKRFLIARYGEFVMLRPAVSWGNAALWAAPFAVVALGLGLWAALLRVRAADETLSEDEAARLDRLSRDEPA
jgi:cytochrome c-type biogenesis protein CcmH